MGLIINQRANHISAPDLLERLGISARNPDDEITSDVLSLSIQVGGPVETGRGFVLHSSDYFSEDFNARHRAGRLPDGHDRYSEGDRAGPRSNASRVGTRLCGLVTGTARDGDPIQRLAALPSRSRSDFRRGSREQIFARPRENGHRPVASRQRRRARLTPRIFKWDFLRSCDPPAKKGCPRQAPPEPAFEAIFGSVLGVSEFGAFAFRFDHRDAAGKPGEASCDRWRQRREIRLRRGWHRRGRPGHWRLRRRHVADRQRRWFARGNGGTAIT